MALSPISKGDASPIRCTFATDSAAFPLTGLVVGNFSMHFIDTATATLRIGTGTWTITSTTNGTADYAPSADDVATAGTYQLYPVLTLSTGPKAFDPQILEIKNLP